MKTQELLELAALDALGLLDEHERDAFDRAFRAAPPALQAQIRGEQTRLAKDDSLLPAVETPIGLKAKVLARWREAMSARRRFIPPLLPSAGVSPIWRMAAVGALAATTVMAVATLQIQSNFKQLAAASGDLEHSKAMMEVLGADYSRWVLGNTQKVAYHSADQAFSGKVAMFLSPEIEQRENEKPTQTAMFICAQFPDSQVQYQLVMTDKDGQIIKDSHGKPRVLDSFKVNNESGTTKQFKISITVEEVQADYNIAIIVPSENNRVIGRLML
ncbi:MAG: hypothetical protein AB7G11_16895 [Phycisphaerales bacterium]